MQYLLDTHTFIWMLAEPEKLGKSAREIIEEGRSLLFLSSATIWEISIKESIGKLTLKNVDLEKVIKDLDINELIIKIPHAKKIKDLKLIHKDPFDRMLIAQALHEGLSLISKDKVFDKYGVGRVW